MSMNSEYSIRENRTPLGAAVAARSVGIRRALASLRVAGSEALRRAARRARLRRELPRLDARQLQDIGRTRQELEIEAAKPFWRR